MDSFLNMVVFDVWNGPDIARVLSQRPRASSRNVLKDSNCKLLHWHKTGKPLAVRRGKRTGLKTRHYESHYRDFQGADHEVAEMAPRVVCGGGSRQSGDVAFPAFANQSLALLRYALLQGQRSGVAARPALTGLRWIYSITCARWPSSRM